MDDSRGGALGSLSRLMGDLGGRQKESRSARARDRDAAGGADHVVASKEIDRFAALVLGGDMSEVDAFVDQLRARGVAPEAIYLGLLQETARRLGEWWLQDTCSFSEVTMGTLRLQQAMRALGPWFCGGIECPLPGHRILLVPSPGEQHTFGLFVVADFFTRAGWDVWGETVSGDGVLRLVREEWFDMIGISVGCEARLDKLTAHVGRLRSASCNRTVGVMVGGPVFVEHPEYAATVGADATAADGREAARAAEALLALITRPG